MTIANSSAWDLFIESLDGGGRDWTNSLDVEALKALKGDELDRAITLLISRMNIGDWRSSRALGELKDPRILPALEAHLPQAKGADRVATASSLLRLGSAKRQAALDAIAEGLADPGIMVASEALNASEIAGPAIAPALIATAVSHPLENIRFGAARRALFVTGVNKKLSSTDHRADAIALAKGDPTQRRNAFTKLCQLMKFDLTVYQGPRP